jgi:hypothetical protein
LQEYNSIYKLEVTPTELIAVKAADLISSTENVRKEVVFSIKTVQDLTTLFTKTTQLFHQHYFRLKGTPLIVVHTNSLERLFNEKIKNLGLGNFTLINLETRNEIVRNHPSPIQFNEWFNEGNVNSEFYFIASETTAFNTWKKSLTQHQINQVFHTFMRHQQLLQLQREKEELIAENRLINQSLNAIKSEYSKELNWYKTEIVTINEWYKNLYNHIPNWFLKLCYVFKLFKTK